MIPLKRQRTLVEVMILVAIIGICVLVPIGALVRLAVLDWDVKCLVVKCVKIVQ